MTQHLTTRLAWHMDGWNGRICRAPSHNTYCIGQHSYPGDLIRERRDIAWEESNAGTRISKSGGQLPPCVYSANAFGDEPIMASAEPPEFFKDGDAKYWILPPATMTIWPYEAMYQDDVFDDQGRYDYNKRLERMREFFAQVEKDKSLIFYYANYSNPLNQQDERRYVVVGMSRIKELGEELFYEGTSEETKKRYGGGFIWQRAISSYYPTEGFRLPYHMYREQPEILNHIAFFPENPRHFKYASRLISDDDALSLIERYLEITAYLQEIGDTSENWALRIEWLQSLISRLWKSRGLYPGLAPILDYLGFRDGIAYFKEKVLAGKEREAYDSLFAFLDGRIPTLPDFSLPSKTVEAVHRSWKLKNNTEQFLLRQVLPRFELTNDQISRLLSNNRSENGLYSSLETISNNPYIITEEYIGDDPDDFVPFSKIDHGVFPSPEFGVGSEFPRDDWRRLRALGADTLRRETKHTFVSATQAIEDINRRLSFLLEYKTHEFSERYFEVDRESLAPVLTIREDNDQQYVYLTTVYEAEREIERQIRALHKRPDIGLKSPLTEAHWENYLYDPDSALAEKSPNAYRNAIAGQVKVCQRIFPRPVSIVSGAAGTGKTTVIRAIIQAIQKTQGTGVSIQVLAPTGKAADRIREATGNQSAATIHSFLSRHSWLNPNLTFKRSGGRREESIDTYIIDEASMLDLELTATFFRSVNWQTVRRLIFVGDSSQLPPIGRGRVFADIIDWLQQGNEESIGYLQTNLRQMENHLTGQGTGILDLAKLFVRQKQTNETDEESKIAAEGLLQAVQEGGPVDKDLRVFYWSDPEELFGLMTTAVKNDSEERIGKPLSEISSTDVWKHIQVISPYRGEPFGIENLNLVLQRRTASRENIARHRSGIAIFDKVIQIRNRANSTALTAYNAKTSQNEKVDVFNGEIGFVAPHGFDGDSWKWSRSELKRFQVRFARKEHLGVNYGSELGKINTNGKSRYIPSEPPDENLELAYAISVHKSQGSEFDHVYFVVPKSKLSLLSRELFYTGLTRARVRCTLFIEQDVAPLLSMRRPENSHLLGINSSLFSFNPIPEALQGRTEWYEEGKIHVALADVMVRSKSEVIIANMLFERDIAFRYEAQLYGPDGKFYLPDFTITWAGDTWYWEHLGRLDNPIYKRHWDEKRAWYDKYFSGRLLITEESGHLSKDAEAIIQRYFS
jgi:exodeoxyribonuclease V alpha subunit